MILYNNINHSNPISNDERFLIDDIRSHAQILIGKKTRQAKKICLDLVGHLKFLNRYSAPEGSSVALWH